MEVMSGTLDLIQRAYLGGEIRGDTLYFDPKETERLDGLSLAMQFRGLTLESLSGGGLTVAAESHGVSRPIKVGLGDRNADSAQRQRHVQRKLEEEQQWRPVSRGAIFDVDGVLVDSPMTAWREAFQE